MIKILIINDINISDKLLIRLAYSKNISSQVVSISYNAPDISHVLKRYIKQYNPTVILHSYKQMNQSLAEREPTKCYKINRDFTEKVAKVCFTADIPLLYISTYFIFDGNKKNEYTENDMANPIGVLATSYLQAEQQILNRCRKYIIIRFSWIIQEKTKNLLTNLLETIKVKKEVVAVSDQQGSPTPEEDCARIIIAIIQQLSCGGDNMWGIYHYASAEPTSTNRFAELVIAEAEKYHNISVKNLRTIKTVDSKGLKPPANAKLNCKKILDTFGIQRRLWKPKIKELIAKYYKNT